MKPKLIVVLGPTASGKTDFAITLAKRYDAEIFSADSRQFYKELNIAVAKPSEQALAAVKHHFIGHISIHNPYSAGNFERDCIEKLTEYFTHNQRAILVGGSGLFVKAVLQGLDEFPQIDEKIRNKLNEEFAAKGLDYLLDMLKEKDFDTFVEIAKDNPRRVIRALEIIKQTGMPFSSFKKAKSQTRSFDYLKLFLDLQRNELYARINNRVDDMLSLGLVKEAQSLWPYQELNALKTVGYTEIFAYLKGDIEKSKAVELIKQHTRNYAKRQLTWFRKENDILKLTSPITETELQNIDEFVEYSSIN